MTFEVVSADC